MASGSTKRGIQVIFKPTVAQLKARHKERLRKLSKLQIPNKKIAVFLDQWVQNNFKAEGKAVGNWEPLKAGGRYIKKKGLDTSAKILQDTGRLRLSFLPFASKSNAGIGSDIPYAKTHEEGKGVPMRRMLPKKKDVLKNIRKIYNGHIKRSTK